MRIVLGLIGLLVALGSGAEVAIGSKIENLHFKDIRYVPRKLEDLGQHKAYVLVFLSNTCPLAQRYMSRLKELEAEYGPKGVVFVGVNASPADSILEMAWHQIEYDAFFPMVKDWDGSCSTKLGITRTPQVALLDAEHVLRYRGRIDDQYRLSGVRPEIERADLRNALDELLAGKKISRPESIAEGCSITLPSVPEPAQPVTYSEHIAPILNRHCAACHRPGGGAPFSLIGYKKALGNAEMVAEVVAEERMPPWYAHPGFGEFANDARLSAAEKLMVQQWVKGGAPEGDPALAPPEPQFSDDIWTINPDMVLQLKSANVLPATGFIPYRYVFLPHVFEQDTWVQGIEIKASNPKVLHHANLFMIPEGLEFDRDANFVTGTVPGGMPTNVQAGRGILFPKGSKLGLQLHYVTTGKVEMDTPMVALRFAKTPIEKKIYYKIIDDHSFRIPPQARAHVVRDKVTLEEEVTILALFSHMHLRGRDMTFYAHYPDGRQEILLALPNYSFDWQLTYYIEPGKVVVPAGTQIESIAHFDNSPFNPYNPDPEKEIRYGGQTVDEMCQGFLFYTKNDENLNIHVDPATGWVVDHVAANP